jgi:hypothetical protein
MSSKTTHTAKNELDIFGLAEAWAGEIYDRLARLGCVPEVKARGRPQRSASLAGWMAWEKRRGKPMLELGAIIRAAREKKLTWQKLPGVLAKGMRSDPATKTELKKLARRYVRAGDAVTARLEQAVLASRRPWNSPERLMVQYRNRFAPSATKDRFQRAIAEAVVAAILYELNSRAQAANEISASDSSDSKLARSTD